FDQSNYVFCGLPKYFIPRRTIKYPEYFYINNITNCPEGTFHSWKTKDKEFVCEICNTILNNLKLDIDLSKEIYINFKYSRLQKLAQKYCLHGSLHNYLLEGDSKNSVCNKCKRDENYKCSKKELDELENNLQKARQKINT